jgi:hypothetical protein
MLLTATEMGLTRRHVMSLLGAAALLPTAVRATAPPPLYLTAYGGRGGYGFAAFDVVGTICYRQSLPRRGHSFACSPDGRMAVTFARRPGDFAVAFNPQTGDTLRTMSAAADRSFCGHGSFSRDSRLLFATEVVASTGEGVLGIYAADNDWIRLGEFRTHGLDPHEVRLMPDGRTLVVANGGILMRSGLPRLKLNLADMDPSLVYLDARDGSLVAQIRPEPALRQLSVRHIVIDRRGRVVVAMQYEGPREDDVPLVALHDAPAGAGQFCYLPIPDKQRQALRQYCGSAAMDFGGRYLAVSSPRGNRVLVWDIERETSAQAVGAQDVCGVAARPDGGFTVSTGLGRLLALDEGGGLRDLANGSSMLWDNHMVPVS